MRLVAVLALLALGAARADEETALYFLDRAKASLAADDLPKAEHWVKRALDERKNYAPCLLLAARVEERLGRRAEAIRRLEACVALGKAGKLTASEQDAVDEARARLKQLDRTRFDFEEIVAGYVEKTLALAARKAKSDPELARECWRNVLLVDPDNEAAKKGLAGPGVEPEVAAGEPLFNGKDLDGWSGGAPDWTVRHGLLVGSVDDSANVNRHRYEVKGDFTLTCVAKIVKDEGPNPLFGIVFGMRGSYDHFGLWIWPDSWRLEHQTGEHERDDLARKDFRTFKAKYDRFDWNTYRITVTGKKITGFVNGVKVWSTSGAIRPLDGFIGAWVQEQTVEIRTLVLEEH